MNNGLLLTLGHGSSAILILNGKIVNGYQTERLTGKKGDSQFPARAIEEIEKWHSIPKGIPIYISHWHPSGNIDRMASRHWNRAFIEQRFPDSEIISTGIDLSHHDAHAYSAVAYNDKIKPGSHVIVADGFGNFGEVLTFYKYTGTRLHIIKRVFGYSNSLGLLYQYATDYVGLKMNQDEWKLNAMANEVSTDRTSEILDLAGGYAKKLFENQINTMVGGPDDPVINVGALTYIHKSVVDLLQTYFKPTDKAEIAFFLQTVVETVMVLWMHELKVEDVTLAGGCFLNVQLNGYLVSHISGSICVMPLSGDEGAALGLYKSDNPDFVIPDDLCWGLRHLDDFDVGNRRNLIKVDNVEDLQSTVHNALRMNKIVNVVRGAMEYGPRAYCNTSTIALPTEDNRQYINHLNNRDQCMPMCPVMTWQHGHAYFKNVKYVYRSLEHMILALPYYFIGENQEGVAHRQLDGSITGRPQFIDVDHWLYPTCNQLGGPLINTSFNNHGYPICFSVNDVIRTHDKMVENDYQNRVITIVEVESKQIASELH